MNTIEDTEHYLSRYAQQRYGTTSRVVWKPAQGCFVMTLNKGESYCGKTFKDALCWLSKRHSYKNSRGTIRRKQ